MPLSELATAGLRLVVWSELLGERVVVGSDNAPERLSEGMVVYRAAELRELLGLGPAELREVHRVKAMFEGRVKATSLNRGVPTRPRPHRCRAAHTGGAQGGP